MILYKTRGLEQVWTESLREVQAHGGEVTRFKKLLTPEGLERISVFNEHTLSMPTDLLIRYGFDGEDNATPNAYTSINVHSNVSRLQRASFHPDMEFTIRARNYEFDKIVAKMEEDVLERTTLHCLFEDKILTTTDIMREWSSDAVQWASQESTWYYNLMVGTYVFDEVDECKKLPKYLFKNTSNAPMTFADAFPNINIYKKKKVEENKKAMELYEKKMGQDTECCTSRTTATQPGELIVSKYLSVLDLGVLVSSLGASAVKQYKKQEKKRARRLALFRSKKLHRFTDYDIEEVIDRQRRSQIKDFLE